MQIADLLCDVETELHIWSGHRVNFAEAEEAVFGRSFILRGRKEGLYEVLGRTEAGRYLMVAVRSLGKGAAKVITAREMDDAERRRYNAHVMH